MYFMKKLWNLCLQLRQYMPNVLPPIKLTLIESKVTFPLLQGVNKLNPVAEQHFP